MFTIAETTRKRWTYEVRWNKGRTICRCDSLRDAKRVTDALNAVKDLDAPLTESEIAAVDRACNFNKLRA